MFIVHWKQDYFKNWFSNHASLFLSPPLSEKSDVSFLISILAARQQWQKWCLSGLCLIKFNLF